MFNIANYIPYLQPTTMKLGGFSWRDQLTAYPGLLTNTTLTWELADPTAKIPVQNSLPLQRIIVTAARMMESNPTLRKETHGMRIHCKSVTNGIIVFVLFHISTGLSISICLSMARFVVFRTA